MGTRLPMSQMAVPNIRVKKPKNRHRERFVLTKTVHDGDFLALPLGKSFTMANYWLHDGELLANRSVCLARAKHAIGMGNATIIWHGRAKTGSGNFILRKQARRLQSIRYARMSWMIAT